MPTTDKIDFRVRHTEIDDDDNLFPVIEFTAADAKARTHRVPMGLLKQPSKAATALMDKGALILGNPQEIIQRLLAEVADSPKKRVTKRGGWIGDDFVTSRLSIAAGKAAVSFDRSRYDYRRRSRKGNYVAFKKGIKRFLAESDFLIFAYLVGLTPAYASRIGRPGSFAVAFRQESTTGKTLCLQLAQSLYARCEESELWSFGNTPGILRDSLPAMGGLCAPFGDIKSAIDMRETASKIHDLIFPAIRRRKGEPANLEPQFFIPMLSAEQPLQRVLRENGLPSEDGEAVRLLEIPVPNRVAGGIFNGADDPAGLATDLANFYREQHGTVLSRWVRKLQKRVPNDLGNRARQREQEFINSLGLLPHHHARVAKHFALVAAVAHLASETKMIPVAHNRCLAVLTHMFRLVVGEIACSEEEQRSFWRDFFALCGDRQLFPLVSIGHEVAETAQGFVRQEGGRKTIHVPQSLLVEKFGDAFVTRILIPRLRQAQLVPRSGETTRSVAQSGLKRMRYLCLKMSRLQLLKEEILPSSDG